VFDVVRLLQVEAAMSVRHGRRRSSGVQVVVFGHHWPDVRVAVAVIRMMMKRSSGMFQLLTLVAVCGVTAAQRHKLHINAGSGAIRRRRRVFVDRTGCAQSSPSRRRSTRRH